MRRSRYAAWLAGLSVAGASRSRSKCQDDERHPATSASYDLGQTHPMRYHRRARCTGDRLAGVASSVESSGEGLMSRYVFETTDGNTFDHDPEAWSSLRTRLPGLPPWRCWRTWSGVGYRRATAACSSRQASSEVPSPKDRAASHHQDALKMIPLASGSLLVIDSASVSRLLD